MSKRKICEKCVLPESKPDIFLDEKGICNICNNYKKLHLKYRNHKKEIFETDFLRIINKKKSKGKYDCLVMYSGGKDSTAALYFTINKFKLNPLVFTFDNTFENPLVLNKINKMIKKLNVDFLYYRSNTMQDILDKILKHKSRVVICHICSIWYMMQTFDIANKYGIKVIIAGWTKGQMNNDRYDDKFREYKSMTYETKYFIKKILRSYSEYKNFPSDMGEVNKRYNKNNAIVISPHWFMNLNDKEYTNIIKKELNWSETKNNYPLKSTNCLLNYLSVYNSMKYYGYTHYHIEKSKLIRDGLISRKEAIKNLEIYFDKKFINKILGIEIFKNIKK
jgi:3'-phosphoadenosine 5'-phosphosulfate sulfotransferase (PAPS reductase)/FAD synthetase